MIARRRSEPPAPEPELSLDGELGLRGVGKVRGGGGARGTPAIVALHRVLIVLGVVVALVVGAVAIVVRAPREELRRPDLGRCTEHIERTPSISSGPVRATVRDPVVRRCRIETCAPGVSVET